MWSFGAWLACIATATFCQISRWKIDRATARPGGGRWCGCLVQTFGKLETIARVVGRSGMGDLEKQRFGVQYGLVCSMALERRQPGNGGAKGDRTPDLLHAMQALSQLSYGPVNLTY